MKSIFRGARVALDYCQMLGLLKRACTWSL
jgi:hypothetical protein